MGASLWDMSTTAASNTTVGGVNVAEGCSPSGLNDGIRAAVAQSLGAVKAFTATGTDTYAVTLAPVPDALLSGMTIRIRFTNANATTTPTLNINSLGAKTIVKNGTAALLAGDIPAGHEGDLRYNGTNMVLLNPAVTTLADATNGGLTVSGSTIAMNVNDLVAKASPVAADSVALYDAAGAATKKSTLTSIIALLPFSAKFTSTDLAITSAGSTGNIAHSLGAAPFGVMAHLVCQTGELGYTAGDVVAVNPALAGSNTNVGISLVFDATNILVRYASDTPCFVLIHKTTGVETSITNGNWKLRLKAWA